MARALRWVEAARTALCALVVLVHVNIYIRAGIENWWPGGFITAPLFGLTVPAFFMISGYLADRGALAAGDDGARRMRARLVRLLVPFVAWNAITLAVLVAAAGAKASAGGAMYQVTTGVWHLYFIAALVQLLLLHSLLLRTLATPNGHWVTIVAVAGTAAFYTISEILVWTHGVMSDVVEFELRKTFIAWAGFYFIGVSWSRRGETLDWSGRALLRLGTYALVAYVLYAAALLLQDRVYYATLRKQMLLSALPAQVAGSIFLLALLRRWERSRGAARLFDALASRGRDSYGVYLAHNAVLVALWSAFLRWDLGRVHWTNAPLFWVATALGSLAVVHAVRALPGSLPRLLLLGEGPRRSDAAPPRPA